MFKAAGHGQFDKILEKATSNLLLETDWQSIIQICDLIRQKDCQPKYAVAQTKKKLYNQNPHVAMFGLQVLESIVKNCGNPVHDEVATKQFMEDLRDLAKTTQHENVRDKILELVQTWAHAFRRLSTYRAVQDVVNIMKAEGAKFPPLVEADAMFVSDTAPEWADSTTCHRCRVEFGIMVRKHHCRACGQVFCGKCTTKTATLPKFGIEKEVRVCDACFERVAKDGVGLDDQEESTSGGGSHIPSSATATAQNKTSSPQQRKKKTDEELQEEEQLQLALAISQSEAEAKERDRYKSSGGMMSALSRDSGSGSSVEQDGKNHQDKSSPIKSTAPSMIESEDPELSRYLNRTYWEGRHSHSKEEDTKEETGKAASTNSILTGSNKMMTTSGSMPLTSASFTNLTQFQPSAPVKENKEKFDQQPPGEVDGFVDSLRAQIETFVTRMKSNSSRGRFIANDTAVQSLFMNITALHSQLLIFIQAQDNARTYYERLQDKLNQVRDARAALDALREQHRERLRIKAEEEERAKRYHMAQMLQIKRQQKQEYLEYQRQLTLQRMQEQEREMQMRIEQQKQQLAQGQFGMNSVYGMNVPGGFMPPPDQMAHYMQQPGVFIPSSGNMSIPGQGPPQDQLQQPHLNNQNLPGMIQQRYPGHPMPGQPNPYPMPVQQQPGLPPHLLQQQMIQPPPPSSQQQMIQQTPSSQQQMIQQTPSSQQQMIQQTPSSQQQTIQPQLNQQPPPQQYSQQQQPQHGTSPGVAVTVGNMHTPTGLDPAVNNSAPGGGNSTGLKEEPALGELISFD